MPRRHQAPLPATRALWKKYTLPILGRESALPRLSIFTITILMCVICYGDRAALAVALPEIIREFHLTHGEAGLVLSSFLWSYFFLNLPSSILLDRIGPRRVGFWAVGIWSAAMIQGAIAWTLPAFILSRIVLGVGESPTFALGATVMRKWAPPAQSGLAMTAFTSGISIGLGLGALASGYLVSRFGWRPAFMLLGVIGFVWCTSWLAIYPARSPQPVQQDHAKRRNFSIRPFFASPSFWGVVVAQCCVNYANFLMMSWLPVILGQKMHLSLFDASWYTACCYAGAVIVSLAAGKAGERLLSGYGLQSGARRYMVAFCLVMVASVGLLPFLQSVPASMICLIVSMGFVTAGSGANMALLADLLVQHESLGAANGLVLTFSNGVGILAPIMTGYIRQITGSFQDVFFMVACVLVAGAVAAMLLPRRVIAVSNGAES